MHRRRDGHYSRDEPDSSIEEHGRDAGRHWRGRNNRRCRSRGKHRFRRSAHLNSGMHGCRVRLRDWWCSKCQWLNYDHRDECQKCSHGRPQECNSGVGSSHMIHPVTFAASENYECPLLHAYHAGYPHASDWDFSYYGTAHYGPVPPVPRALWCDGTVVAGAWADHVIARRDFAEERPEAYRAFLQHVRRGADGAEVALSDRMCLDHHVGDLLLCLESWLMREHGPPLAHGQPWRLGLLDLARNGLSDESIARIIERLKQLDVRLRRLDMDSNATSMKGMFALVEYIWNCPEPLFEIGLVDNRIMVHSADDGDDAVSAVLRCLYNHPGYPRKSQSDKGTHITPLVLRLGGNFIADGGNLLLRIEEKGGSNHVRFCSSAESYLADRDEYLAIFLPGFHQQHHDMQGAIADINVDQRKDVHVDSLKTPAANGDVLEHTGASKTLGLDVKVGAGVVPEATGVHQASTTAGEVQFDSVVREAHGMEATGNVEGKQEGKRRTVRRVKLKRKHRQVVNMDADVEVRLERQSEANLSEVIHRLAHAETNPSPKPHEAALHATFCAVGRRQATQIEVCRPESFLNSRARSSSSRSFHSRHGDATQQDIQAAGPILEVELGVSALKSESMPSRSESGVVRCGSHVLDTLHEGYRAHGRVTLVRDTFALIDFGAGIDGMLHISDLAHTARKVDHAFGLGDAVHVEVRAICNRRKHVSLKQVVFGGTIVQQHVDRKTRLHGASRGEPVPRNDIERHISCWQSEHEDSARINLTTRFRHPSEVRRLEGTLRSRRLRRVALRKLEQHWESTRILQSCDKLGVKARAPPLVAQVTSGPSCGPQSQLLAQDFSTLRVRAHDPPLSGREHYDTPIRIILRSDDPTMHSVEEPAAKEALANEHTERHKAASKDRHLSQEPLNRAFPIVDNDHRGDLTVATSQSLQPRPSTAFVPPSIMPAEHVECVRRAEPGESEPAPTIPSPGGVVAASVKSKSKRRRIDVETQVDGAGATVTADSGAILQVHDVNPPVMLSASAESTSSKDVLDDSFGDAVDETLSDEEQRYLERDVVAQLEETPGLPPEPGTKEELSEFVVCLLLARKKPSEVQSELAAFLANNTTNFVSWLTAHLRGPWLRARRARAGATPKAAVARNRRGG